jgi:hypothetical protein
VALGFVFADRREKSDWRLIDPRPAPATNLWATSIVLAQFAVDQRTARFNFTIPSFEWALIFFPKANKYLICTGHGAANNTLTTP